jgi:hypothetical protein
MKGPPPKPAELRQRQNRSSTRATLPSVEASAGREVPELPKREKATEVWHPKVLEWWASVWKSPMAAEYEQPDIQGGLRLLAELYQQRWSDPDLNQLIKLAAEIRQQEIRFGLSPIDRRRLEWEIEKGETATDRTEKRRNLRRLSEVAKKDPRDVLKVVSS